MLLQGGARSSQNQSHLVRTLFLSCTSYFPARCQTLLRVKYIYLGYSGKAVGNFYYNGIDSRGKLHQETYIS